MSRNIFAFLEFGVLLLAASAAAAPRIHRDALIYDGLPPAEPGSADRVDAYLSARQATVLGWSPEGKLLISTRFGNVAQLHLLDRAGGERRQLTFYDDPVTQAAFAPAMPQNAFVFRKDTGGDGRYQLYYRRLDEPAARRLTDGKSVNGGSGMGEFRTRRSRFPARRATVIVPTSTSSSRHRGPRSGSSSRRTAQIGCRSIGRRTTVNCSLSKPVSAAETHLYLIDVASGEKRELDAAPARRRSLRHAMGATGKESI